MELPRGYISYNQIKLYRACPRKYYYIYLEGLSTPIDDKIYTGIVVHKVIENYLQMKIQGGVPERAEILEMYDRIFEANDENHEIIWQKSRGKVKSRGVNFIKYFMENVGLQIDPLMVEAELEAEINGIRVRGVIDLVETNHILSDFKTARMKWSVKRVQHSALQMYIYRYLLLKACNIDTKDLRFKIFSSKTAGYIRYQDIKLEEIDEKFEFMGEQIRATAELIQSEAFEPRKGQLCSNCFFRERCQSGSCP